MREQAKSIGIDWQLHPAGSLRVIVATLSALATVLFRMGRC